MNFVILKDIELNSEKGFLDMCPRDDQDDCLWYRIFSKFSFSQYSCRYKRIYNQPSKFEINFRKWDWEFFWKNQIPYKICRELTKKMFL